MLRLGLASLLLISSTMADAAQFHLVYTTSVDATSGPAVVVDAILSTDDGQFYGGNGYQVLSISGTRGSQALSFDLSSLDDEIYFPADGIGNYVDDFGLDLTAGGVTYNLYRRSGDFAYHEFDRSTGRLVFDRDISLTRLAAVPEPASWAMFIGGFGLAGAAMRHRRKTRDPETN